MAESFETKQKQRVMYIAIVELHFHSHTESGVGNPLRRYADTIPLNSWTKLVLILVCSV